MRAWKSMCAVALLMCAPACVKKTDYEALQKRANDDQAQAAAALEAEQGKGHSLEQALAAEQGKSKAQAEEIARLQEQLEAAHKKQLEQQDQLTQMVKDSSTLKASIQDMQRALAALETQRKATEA